LGSLNQFNSATCLYMFQVRTWISNVICRGHLCVQWVQTRWEVIVRFVDIRYPLWFQNLKGARCKSFFVFVKVSI
jgi:hypothetical protein